MFAHDVSSQDFFDAYNQFIMSSDKKVLAKLISKWNFCQKVVEVPGDILELGVFKGSGMFGWLKTNSLCSVNSRKVHGFDMFSEASLIATMSGSQKEMMSKLFEQRGFSHDTSSYDTILADWIVASGFENFELHKGDIFDTLPQFLDSRPGFRAAIVNFDLDTALPTSFAMNLLWERLVPGGVFVFDEYAIDEWDESDAVDEFIEEKKLKLEYTGLQCPSAYILKL